MAPIIEFTASDRSIGLLTRSTREGPESQLTSEFIENRIPILREHKRHYAIFCEPMLETGFPDIVIVSYNPKAFDNWQGERSKLTVLDIKILHHLHFRGGANAHTIEKELGVNSNDLIRSLERLLESKLIRWYSKQWMPRSLKTRFAVRSIVAIEAKIKNWRTAFKQAELNRWFASESYVLLPVSNPQEKILVESEKLGIGIYSMPNNSYTRKIIASKQGQLPSSYASWLFNEWIGRRLYN